ncbi:hypothetical protein HZC21_06630 [Candidatus Peregrinibacteria bacterium]|nr:hypothetical protein [Candidatus Peregrinibacteria bacterium]
MTRRLVDSSNSPPDSLPDLPPHITERIKGIEKAIAGKISFVSDITRAKIIYIIEGILDRTLGRIEKVNAVDRVRLNVARPNVTLNSGDTVTEDLFEQARQEFQAITAGLNQLSKGRKRYLNILYLRVFESKTVEELMAEFSLSRSNVKTSGSRGVDLVWRHASENLRRVLLGAKPAVEAPQTPPLP